MRASSWIAAALIAALAGTAQADPCGMVPPIWEGQGPAITRVGEQMTYVFYKQGKNGEPGIESFVIRPGFSGKVDEFGMLIPFPTPPALRKVDDGIFDHIAKAIDPPEVVIRVWQDDWGGTLMPTAAPDMERGGEGLRFKEEVRVIKEEAVGMYQVAVLEAGSAEALTRWLDDHGYRYPEGMEPVAQDYVTQGWCFVAVKTQVGTKRGVTPAPGMTEADPTLPAGAAFDGNVQAMGFRFRTPELVVPMRLSAFNAGELHNVVYLLTDAPMRAKDLDVGLVVRQLPGESLFRNVTEPLPVRVIGGTFGDIPDHERETLPQRRNPVPHNGQARDLFAGDLLAARLNKLALPHEETEKVFLRIGERLGLRGEEIDQVHREELVRAREIAVEDALVDLRGMTLTVFDGDLPRDYIGEHNIRFEAFSMEGLDNTPVHYDAKRKGPATDREGNVYGGTRPVYVPPEKYYSLVLVLIVALTCLGLSRREA